MTVVADMGKELLRSPLSVKVGWVIILIYALVAIFAPHLAPHTENEIVGGKFLPWSAEFPLGTDLLGRDILSRIIYGAQNSIGIALAAVVIAFPIGCLAGFVSASLGGWADHVMSRAIDAIMAVPSLIAALLLLTVFGTDLFVLIMVIAMLDAARLFRLSRAVASTIVVLDYVEVARLRGEGIWWVIAREVLPNATAPLLAECGLRFCHVFLTMSALSFLGLGIQPPTADWGSMVRDTAALISFGIPTPLVPAAAIGILTVGINFVVDWFLNKSAGLKDVTDG